MKQVNSGDSRKRSWNAYVRKNIGFINIELQGLVSNVIKLRSVHAASGDSPLSNCPISKGNFEFYKKFLLNIT
jgi:hypothetical protein